MSGTRGFELVDEPSLLDARVYFISHPYPRLDGKNAWSSPCRILKVKAELWPGRKVYGVATSPTGNSEFTRLLHFGS